MPCPPPPLPPPPPVPPPPTATPAPTATPSPTAVPAPTATPAPTTRVEVTSSRDTLCAGGWNDSRKDYLYLEKETGKWVERKAPDVHVAVVTATVTDEEGNPVEGEAVTFSWDMPGPAPAENRTVTSDSDGIAKVDVISGDEVSTDIDEKGVVLFDEPVIITIKYGDEKKSQSLDVKAPHIEWQYKNGSGTYVLWKGEIWGLYKNEFRRKIPLRALLTFDNLPVGGHQVSWGFEGIYDKAGAPVEANEPLYASYGRLSGNVSTTPVDGGASATFTRGTKWGQVVFKIEDASVFTHKAQSPSSDSPNQNRTSQADPSATPTPMPAGRVLKKSNKPSPKTKEYLWVKGGPAWLVGGNASPQTPFAYPAPAGEEDDELLYKTLNLVRSTLGMNHFTGFRNPKETDDPYGDPENPENPVIGTLPKGWWFAQNVGNDPESAGYHFADLKLPVLNPKTGKPKRDKKGNKFYSFYTAAFDIVYSDVPIFERRGRRASFGLPVYKLRRQGIVAWHRWAGEDRNKDGNLAATENEIHCIDPATPYIKSGLRKQIGKFRNGGSGGTDYNPEPTNPANPFAITRQQIDAVDFRSTIKRAEFRRVYSKAIPLGDAK